MPTIAQNLQRLQQARTAIANSIVAKGGTVPTGDGLEEFAADISTIAPYEMTGELPLTFKSDGENLRDYAVKGKNGGIGERTKNLLPITVEGIKAAAGGTWSGNSRTLNGITFTIQTDSVNNVTSILANGTADADAYFRFVNTLSTDNNVIISGCPTNGGQYSYRMYAYDGTDYFIDTGTGANIPANTNLLYVVIHIANGYNAQNLLFKPMIRLASDTDPTFEPYGYKIPITCGNTTTNLYTPDKLYEGDTLTYAQTGVDIPTVDGANLIDSTLEAKPSMFIEYGDNEEVNVGTMIARQAVSLDAPMDAEPITQKADVLERKSAETDEQEEQQQGGEGD
jgi:hypothetical protein